MEQQLQARETVAKPSPIAVIVTALLPIPFLGNVYHGQIQHFQQTVIGWEDGLGFNYLAQLTDKALNGVGDINQPPDFMGILEISAEVGPIIPPGAGNLGIFLAPALSKSLQGA